MKRLLTGIKVENNVAHVSLAMSKEELT